MQLLLHVLQDEVGWQDVDADLTILGWCVASLPVRGLYRLVEIGLRICYR